MKARGNPYLPENRSTLHNFVTSVCTLPAVSERSIHFIQHGCDLFRNERFVVKSRKLSDTIKKVNLTSFIEIPTAEKKQQNSDALVKELSNVQKNIDIARGQGITLSEILQHDLLATNVLFSDDITSKPEKHMLVKELENLFDANELSFTKASHIETPLAVDFMSMVRRLKISRNVNLPRSYQCNMEKSQKDL